MAAFIGLESLPFKAPAGNLGIPSNAEDGDRIGFGSVHLNNTDLKAATDFWTRVVGMKVRESTDEFVAFGSERHTLVVVHLAAKHAFQEGYSGLYHYAIHAPDKAEFARMIHRLIVQQHSFTPVDHTMSKSIYLRDPDGVLLEFVLETPERFKRVVAENGLYMQDTDGTIRGASDLLNVEEQLKALPTANVDAPIHPDTKIGHIHFHATDVDKTNTFYKALGFVQFNYLAPYKYADVGAGGAYKHRVAMNSWHGVNKPNAPKDNAGLRHYNIVYDSSAILQEALSKVSNYEKREDGYWLSDPSGNLICLNSK